MSQPSADPGCPIFDENGNVRTDDKGRVILAENYQRRAAVTYQKNDSRLHDYVSTNFKMWQIVGSWFIKLAAIVVTTYGALEWVAAPRFREAIKQLNAPLALEIKLQEKRMDLHELDLAKTVPLYYTKEEIDRQIDRLQIELDDLRKLHDQMHNIR